MTTYPDMAAGRRITGALLRSMVEDVTRKTTQTARTSTTTVTNDPELSGIALPVGLHYIKVVTFFSMATGNSGVDCKIAWAFTGTASGFRGGDGPATASTDHNNTTMQTRGASFATENTYGLSNTNYHTIREEGLLDVSVAGDFSIKWSQSVSSATAVNLNVGSYVLWRQVG